MQTWEYAPQYALRTYAYLLPMVPVAKCFQYLLDWLPSPRVRQLSTLLLLSPSSSDSATTSIVHELGAQDKPLLFAMLRSSLALASCYSELSFWSAIHDVLGPTLAHWTALCSLTAAGNFHASQALLPSSSVMILWRLSTAHQLRENHAWAIGWGLLAVLTVGWPFCAVLFVTTGVWALWQASGLGHKERDRTFRSGQVMRVLARTACHAVAIQTAVMAIDYQFYGRMVSPVWNIFVYNAQSGGDELYGTEPLSYYAKNLLLNFNMVALLGIASLPILGLKRLAKHLYPKVFDGDCKPNNITSIEILVLIPMYVWMVMVFPRPHKEERFLFPIYPMICFGASITLRESLYLMNIVALAVGRPVKKQVYKAGSVSLLLGVMLLSPAAVLSLSRSFALNDHYLAPLDLYRKFYSHAIASSPVKDEIVYICTAGEWYRFPSSFHLPANHQLGFLRSSFTGQLPQPFTIFGSKEESLRVQDGKFNAANKEEIDRYLNIEQCSYIVEMVPAPLEPENSNNTPECLQYMAVDSSDGSWILLASYDYLDALSTPLLLRTLHLPIIKSRKVVYNGYNLYQKIKPTK